MGSMINLSIGNLEIDWGKNSGFANHTALFQRSDLADVPYWYVKDHQSNDPDWILFAERREGFCSPVWKVAARLSMIGITHSVSKLLFDSQDKWVPEDEALGSVISFDQMTKAVHGLDPAVFTDDNLMINRKTETILNSSLFENLKKITGHTHFVNDYLTDDSPNALHPYVFVYMLSLHPKLRNLPVYWSFDDVVQGGYVKRDTIVKPLEKVNRFLVVTEGSSDVAIIRHALKLLRPELLDFFDFVDMNEGYPFTGTGNMVNFVKGLISIGIQNNVIVLFDNDAEGNASFNRCQALNIPDNMKVIKLPELDSFKDFPTIGPDGIHLADINGRGVAIECFLDLSNNPKVRWNNFNKTVQSYQAELEDKDSYKMKFLEMKQKKEHYDFSKLESLLDYIINQCITIREVALIKEIKNEPEDY